MGSLPDATIRFLDGGLGTVAPNTSRASLAIGACSRGVANQWYSHSDNVKLRDDLGDGPLPEARAQTLNVAGGPVYSVPANVSNFGGSAATAALAAAGTYSTATTHVGPGAGSVVTSFAPDRRIDAKVTAGALGTMTVSFSVGGGGYSAPVTSVGGGPWTVSVPGTLTKLTFAAATYVLNDVYTVDTLGNVTVAGTGPAGNVTQASSPLDKYDVLITVKTSGALGAGTFTFATDNNAIAGSQQVPDPSPAIQIPTAGKYAIPGTGVVLTFSGAFVAADTYAFYTAAPSCTNSDVVNALTAAFAVPLTWFCVHIAGTPTSAANAATLAAIMDTQMTIAEAAFRYTFAVVQAPHDADIGGTANDNALQTAFANWSSLRVAVMAGDCRIISGFGKKILRRNIAYAVVARLASIKASVQAQDVGQESGTPTPVKNVLGIYRDEGVTEFLDALGFTTMRTIVGLNIGYFVTRAQIFAPTTSDYRRISNRRVIDLVAAAIREKAIAYVGGKLASDAGGVIRGSTASVVEGAIENHALLKVGDDVVDIVVTIPRDTKVGPTATLPVNAAVKVWDYSDFINITIGATA